MLDTPDDLTSTKIAISIFLISSHNQQLRSSHVRSTKRSPPTLNPYPRILQLAGYLQYIAVAVFSDTNTLLWEFLQQSWKKNKTWSTSNYRGLQSNRNSRIAFSSVFSNFPFFATGKPYVQNCTNGALSIVLFNPKWHRCAGFLSCLEAAVLCYAIR